MQWPGLKAEPGKVCLKSGRDGKYPGHGEKAVAVGNTALLLG